MKAIEMSGRTFGRWRVLHESGRKNGSVAWRCICECGAEADVSGYSLRSGVSKSCGCLKREAGKLMLTKHSKYMSPEYRSWAAMWQRCTNENSSGFKAYRLMTPPKRWRDFANFFTDMGPKPTSGHSIDRIDSSKPYGPENCRWATAKEQGRNTQRVIRVLLNGCEMSLPEACEKADLKYANVKAQWFKTKDMLKASLGRFDIAGDKK